jgi:hypothetical protein
VVDDVIYIFGGRGVDGKDLGDLAAFKLSSECLLHQMTVFCMRLAKGGDGKVQLLRRGQGTWGEERMGSGHVGERRADRV